MLAIASTLTAGQIFAKARLAEFLHSYPRFVSYVVDVQSTAYDKHYREGYATTIRTHDGALTVQQKPVYTTNKPVNPYGFTFFGYHPEGKPEDHIPVPIGIPMMSPLYDFGLSKAPEPRPSPSPAAPSSAAPVIGRVTVYGADYEIELAGEEAVSGHDTYHLTLAPLRDPEKNRLRDLWIDTHTFEVWRLVTAGIFDAGPAATVPWTVTFASVGGYMLISSESTKATIGEYGGVTYAFEDVEYPSFVPGIEFFDRGIKTEAVQR